MRRRRGFGEASFIEKFPEITLPEIGVNPNGGGGNGNGGAPAPPPPTATVTRPHPTFGALHETEYGTHVEVFDVARNAELMPEVARSFEDHGADLRALTGCPDGYASVFGVGRDGRALVTCAKVDGTAAEFRTGSTGTKRMLGLFGAIGIGVGLGVVGTILYVGSRGR